MKKLSTTKKRSLQLSDGRVLIGRDTAKAVPLLYHLLKVSRIKGIGAALVVVTIPPTEVS